MTVTVADVDEPAEVSFEATAGVSVNDNALAVDENYDGTLATFSASDPESKAGLTYQLSVDAHFAISELGVLTFAAIPDYERPAGGNNVYDITVSALDSDGKTGSIAVTVTVRPVNEPPTISSRAAAPSIEEEGAVLVGTYTANDPERATIAWQPLGGSDSDKFDFNTSNGRLTFKAAPDFEDPERRGDNVYDVTLSVSAGGHTTTLDVAVTVTNKEEPGLLKLPTTQPQEEAAYTATLSDPDGVQSTVWTWERSMNRSDWTAVSGSVDSTTTSVYRPVTGDVGDYLRVTAVYTDGHGSNKRFVAVSTDAVLEKPVDNRPPMFTETSPTRSIAENARATARVGDPVTATDPDPDNTVRYEFDPRESDLFTIVGNSGQIRVKTQGVLDYDDQANRSHTATVKALDSSNAFDTVVVTIEVTDVNEPPDAVPDAPDSFFEDTAVTIDVLANDSDPEDDRSELLLTVFNSGPDAPRNGTVTVEEPASVGLNRMITYEPNADYNGSDTFTYRVRDTGSPSLSSTTSVAVEVDTVNDARTFASPTATRSVSERAEAGDNVGAPVTAMDVDENDTLTYSLSGADASSFDIDAEGQIKVGTVVVFDAAIKSEYTVAVEARDGAPKAATVVVTITVRARPVRPPIIITGPVAPRGPTPSAEDFEWTVSRDIEALDGGNDWPTGLWSDGATLWLAENGEGADDEVYAYALESGERVEEREFELAETNRAPRGFWSDGETVWVSDSGQDRLFAYDLESGERVAERELELPRDNRDPRGIWSDRETMWVLDGRADALFGYDLGSGELHAEYALHDDNDDPHGIWSDRVTVWVSNHDPKRLFAYRLPTPEGPAAEDADAIPLERVRDEEFRELSRASNNSPRGIWSDGAVMYVADQSDDKVYSYNMPDAIDARLASLSLSGIDIGEFAPGRPDYEGVVADGVMETTLEAEAAQSGAAVVIEPADADEDADGYQVALEDVSEITVTVTSADGSRTKVYRVRLAEPAPAADCLRGAVASGFSLVVSAGGSVEELEACAQSRHVTALHALHDGEYVSYILGAQEFGNREFSELYPDGLPALTPLIAKSEGPPSEAPAAGEVTEPWPECLRGAVATGFSLVVSQGGSVAEFASCAEGLDVSALYTLREGVYASYILGAPAFVNAQFVALFPAGLPAVTPLLAKSGEPPARGDGAAEN